VRESWLDDGTVRPGCPRHPGLTFCVGAERRPWPRRAKNIQDEYYRSDPGDILFLGISSGASCKRRDSGATVDRAESRTAQRMTVRRLETLSPAGRTGNGFASRDSCLRSRFQGSVRPDGRQQVDGAE